MILRRKEHSRDVSRYLALSDYLPPTLPRPIIVFRTIRLPRQTLSVQRIECLHGCLFLGRLGPPDFADYLEVYPLQTRHATVGRSPLSGTCGRHSQRHIFASSQHAFGPPQVLIDKCIQGDHRAVPPGTPCPDIMCCSSARRRPGHFLVDRCKTSIKLRRKEYNPKHEPSDFHLELVTLETIW